jgi:replicative DNA helicase
MTETATMDDPGIPTEGTPQQDLAAERAVLGGCMMVGQAIDEATEAGLRGRDFHLLAHEWVWDSIRALHDTGQMVDPVVVADDMAKRGTLARAGGQLFVFDLLRETPTWANAAHYAKIVRDRATIRRLAAVSVEIAQSTRTGADADTLVNSAQNKIAEVAEARLRDRPDRLPEVADRALDQIENPTPAIPTPWGILNNEIDGFRPGYLYVIGARPAVGKTVVALQAAVAFAWFCRNRDAQVVYDTWEMTSERLYTRALSTASGVDGRRLRHGNLTEAEWSAVLRADGNLRALPLHMEGMSGATPQQVRARTRQLHRKRPVGLLVVDHIGLTTAERSRDNRQAELSEASDLFLAVAHDLNCAVLLLTQLNRGPTQRSDQRPVPSDVRDTDRLQQDADVMILLHRILDGTKAEAEIMTFLIGKNRDGNIGSCDLRFDGARSVVLDISAPSAPPPVTQPARRVQQYTAPRIDYGLRGTD